MMYLLMADCGYYVDEENDDDWIAYSDPIGIFSTLEKAKDIAAKLNPMDEWTWRGEDQFPEDHYLEGECLPNDYGQLEWQIFELEIDEIFKGKYWKHRNADTVV